MQHTLKGYLKNALKGVAMGAADVVPGVSGGTIAFVTGIYEELIESINAIGPETIRSLRNEGLAATWRSVNGPFLLSLLIGIAISVFSLAKLMTFLMKDHPVPLWSFFFGLIIASAVYIGVQIKKWSVATVVTLLIGAIIAYTITILSPAEGDVGLPYLFLTGAVAICAMILPGISGSFIALLMGSYATILGAIGNFSSEPMASLPPIAAVMSGAVIGLLAFSRLLKWLFAKYHDLTMALLTGFMIGSLNKIWPWKQVLTYRINSHGESVPLLDTNVSPNDYVQLTGQPAQLALALGLMLAGILVVYLLSIVDMEKADHSAAS